MAVGGKALRRMGLWPGKGGTLDHRVERAGKVTPQKAAEVLKLVGDKRIARQDRHGPLSKETAIALRIARTAALAVAIKVHAALPTGIGRRCEMVCVGKPGCRELTGQRIKGAAFEVIVDPLEGDDIGLCCDNGIDH